MVGESAAADFTLEVSWVVTCFKLGVGIEGVVFEFRLFKLELPGTGFAGFGLLGFGTVGLPGLFKFGFGVLFELGVLGLPVLGLFGLLLFKPGVTTGLLPVSFWFTLFWGLVISGGAVLVSIVLAVSLTGGGESIDRKFFGINLGKCT